MKIKYFMLFKYAGLPITHSGLLNNREQPRTSTVPSLAPVGGRLPPPLPPQNLLYSVSERKHNLLLHFTCPENDYIIFIHHWYTSVHVEYRAVQ